jgi:2-dehydro-3-deoxygluconokinase
MLAIRAGGSDVHAGHIDAARYRDVAIAITERFPNVKRVAITLRESVSATHNRWGAMLYEAGTAAATAAAALDADTDAGATAAGAKADSGAPLSGTDAPAPTSRGVACFSPLRDGTYTPFEITSIVDRVGAGDSFGAALIVALRDPSLGEAQTALDFAVAASALCHSVVGDINYVTRDEVMALAGGNASGRVQR